MELMNINGFEFAKKYWSMYIEDYLSCFYKAISQEDTNRIIRAMFDSDRMWQVIEEVIEDCLVDLEIKVKYIGD